MFTVVSSDNAYISHDSDFIRACENAQKYKEKHDVDCEVYTSTWSTRMLEEDNTEEDVELNTEAA